MRRSAGGLSNPYSPAGSLLRPQDVIQVSKKFLPGMAVGYSSSKLTLHVGDGFEFMKQNQDAFDVIITDSSDPMGKQGMGLGSPGGQWPEASLPSVPTADLQSGGQRGSRAEAAAFSSGHSLAHPGPGSAAEGERATAQSYKLIGGLEESGALALAPGGSSFLLSLLPALKRPASGRVVGSSLNPRPGVESPPTEWQ